MHLVDRMFPIRIVLVTVTIISLVFGPGLAQLRGRFCGLIVIVATLNSCQAWRMRSTADSPPLHWWVESRWDYPGESPVTIDRQEEHGGCLWGSIARYTLYCTCMTCMIVYSCPVVRTYTWGAYASYVAAVRGLPSICLPDHVKKAIANSLVLRRNCSLLYEQLNASLLLPLLKKNHLIKEGVIEKVEMYHKQRHAQNMAIVDTALSVPVNIQEICRALEDDTNQQKVIQHLLQGICTLV